MPDTIREYLYAILILTGACAVLAGAVVFWAAMSLSAFVIGALTLLVGGLLFAAAWKLKPLKATEDIAALSGYLGAKKTDNKKAANQN